MNRIKRLQRVEDIRADQERSAGRELAQEQQDQASKEQLLEQLLQYRREYQQMFDLQSSEGLDAGQFCNFQPVSYTHLTLPTKRIV